MHTNRNIYGHTETIHTPTTGAQSHRITHTSTEYYTRSHVNNHTSQTHPHKAKHTVPHTVIITHPSRGHTVIHNNRHFPFQPRRSAWTENTQSPSPPRPLDVSPPVSLARRQSPGTAQTLTPGGRTAPRRAAGLRTRRPLGKVVQHRIREGQDGLGLAPSQRSPQSLPPSPLLPHPSLRPCPGIFWRCLAPRFLVGVTPQLGVSLNWAYHHCLLPEVAGPGAVLPKSWVLPQSGRQSHKLGWSWESAKADSNHRNFWEM